MGIDDIVNDKVSPEERAQMGPASNGQSGDEGSTTTASSASSNTGTLTIEVPDPMSGDREAMLFWLNVVQTFILLLLLLRR